MRIPPKLWIVIRCLLLLYCTILLIQAYFLFDDYHTYRTQTNVRLRHQTYGFPAVTVCNLNTAVYSEFTSRNGTQSYLNSPSSRRTPLVHYCSFNGQDCELSKHFRLLSDNYFDQCFTYNFNQSIVMLSSRYGPAHGLRLLLKQSHESDGARIVVHSQGHHAIPERFGQNAPSGTVTSLGYRTKVIRRLAAPFGVCRENVLEDGSEYSQERCYLQCRNNHILQSCNCAEPRDPSKNHRPCDPKNDDEWRCLNKQKERESSPVHPFECNCPPACAETIYETSYSSAVLPPIITHCKDIMSKDCKQFSSANTTLIEVYSEGNYFEQLIEQVVYPLPRLISDVTRNIVFAALIALVAMMMSSRTTGKYQRFPKSVDWEDNSTFAKA